MFQLMGWGMFLLINTFFAISFNQLNLVFLGRSILFVAMGILFTELMRQFIRKVKLLNRPLNAQIFGTLLINLFFSLVIALVFSKMTLLMGIRIEEEMEVKEAFVIISNTFYSFVYLFIWSLIYFIVHYVDQSRSQQLDTLRLQALVKELELKTIKSHINPHFIFNALNSIRALIDENPERARNAITRLSNILRSSMHAENIEMVPLSRELEIVRDYLALEHIRFEERLKVEYQIAEETMPMPVPYMMLQTLVENAIKHGISQHVQGGLISIQSFVSEGCHQLVIRNSGKMNGQMNKSGFGLQSTSSRLGMLFGKKANFEIRDLPGNLVEAKVNIPVHMQ